jgi:hypothetical protein
MLGQGHRASSRSTSISTRRVGRWPPHDQGLCIDRCYTTRRDTILAGSVIRRAWRGARKAVLPPHVVDSPTGRRVYDNRHTRLTKWLNDGIPPAQVAEWAGNGVPVLLATYARCVEGQLPDLKRRLEAAGGSPRAA